MSFLKYLKKTLTGVESNIDYISPLKPSQYLP